MTTERRVAAGLGLLGLALGLSVGCARELFPDDLPRSPYERYQLLHNQARPKTEPDAYGIERPALRDRLRPLGSP